MQFPGSDEFAILNVGRGAITGMGDGFLDRFHAEAGDVLASIFAHSCDCIKLMTPDGELEFVSDSARDALGLQNVSDAIGRNWPEMWPHEQRAALREALARAARGSGARFEGGIGEGADRRFWEVAISPVRGAGDAITHLLAVSTDVTAHVQAAQLQRERTERAERETGIATTLAQELRHRLKNQLAVVGAIVKLLARHSSNVRELASKIDEKLMSLSRAQDLLTIRRDQPISADEAVTLILANSGAGERVEIEPLPDARLSDEAVQQVALLIGELQTNALKYGALKTETGRVLLSGQRVENILTLHWREHCDRAVSPVVTGSGGFQLIRRLGAIGEARATIGWHETGIEVDVHIRVAD